MGGRSGNGERQQGKWANLISHVTYTPCTLAPRLPDMCEKNVFRFFRASASAKEHLPWNHLFYPLLISVDLSECQKLEQDSLQFSSPLTVQSPVEAFFTNSPLKSLVASPQLRSKQNQVWYHPSSSDKVNNCMYMYLPIAHSGGK